MSDQPLEVSSEKVVALLAHYQPSNPDATAAALRDYWLMFEPLSVQHLTAEQREQQEIVGTPIPILKAISKEIGKTARKRVADFIPLARLLWDKYGREGRAIAALMLGKMELADPDAVMSLLMELCRNCVSWEDADRLAMDALEPIVRKQPDQWLPSLEAWLDDDNRWVKRAGVTVVGRLPMKYASYTTTCLNMAEKLLHDDDREVRRAVSFAIRVAARGEVEPVRALLARQVPPSNAAATWVLCDIIRSMATKLLPAFVDLLPQFEQWAADAELSAQDRRSVESAVKKLRSIQ